jgi:Putative peptidoglycan binding domain
MSSSRPSQLAGEIDDPPVRVRRLRPSRRGLLALCGLAIVVAAVVLVVADPFGGGGNASGGVVDNTFPTGVASVTRQSLSSQTQVSATLGYAGTSSIVAPAGTAPSDVLTAHQSVTSDEGMLQANRATLAADSETLSQLRASLTAAQAKQSVECGGVNAAQAASSGQSGSGGSSSGACASDVQTVSTDEQSLSGDVAKVAGDATQVAAAQRSLAGDEASLAVAESAAAVYGQNSTYTTLPAIGRIVRRGQSLYAISGVPDVLLYGAVAAWRAFVPGMSAGRDVAELNANLRALGYGRNLEGDTFTAATAAAIEAFQSAHGLGKTGQLLLGSVVFEPGPVRVTSVTPTVGATVQPGTVLGTTSTVRQVTIALDAGQQAEIKLGDPVTITLPNNQTTRGKVTYVGTVATTPSDSGNGGGGGGGSSTPTIEVDVTPSDPAATGRLDQAPVNVSITTASVKNALVVPVAALLALGSGGYALEVIGAGGAHRLVAVSVGLFDDAIGLVQVSGAGVAAGQRVVVPSE